MARRFVLWMTDLSGWQRALFIFLLGALAALSMAPIHFVPAVFISFPLFLTVLDAALFGLTGRAKFKAAMVLGWFFGFGYFVAGLWWIGAAFLHEAEQYAWALPLGVAGLPAIMAIYWACACGFAQFFWQKPVQKIFSLALGFALAEYLRGNLFFGFPWNAIGYSVMPNTLTMQSASILGIWGVTLMALIAMLLPALWLIRLQAVDNLATLNHVRLAMALSAVLLLGHIGYGSYRLQQPGATSASPEDGSVIRIVQPNISQRDKWRRGNEKAVFETYLKYTSLPGLDQVDAVIWPESAFPFLILENDDALSQIDALMPDDAILLTGGVRASREHNEPAAGSQTSSFRNSLLVFNADAQLIHTYDKRNLVPFGEYIPFRHVLEWLGVTGFVRLPGGFEPGLNSNVMAISTEEAGQPILPPLSALICYEIVFSGGFDIADAQNGNGGQQLQAQWMLNITNDAWFGLLFGPHQHFHQARLRAVEQGLPLVRVANTGISAYVDSYGRILSRLDLGEAGIIDIAFPEKLGKLLPTTIFSQIGIFPFVLLSVLINILIIRVRIFYD